MPEVPPSRPRRFRILSTRWCRGVAVTLGRLLTARYSGERHDGRLTVTWSPPTIHRPERPRQPRHLEPLDLDPSERLAPDHRLDVQVEAAAVTHDLFDRVEPTLPRPDLRVAAEPVLQEGEPTSWPEHPKDLDQSLLDLGDAAHGPGAHHAVEDPVVKWQSLAARGPLIDFDPTGSDPSPGLLVHAGVGIDRGDLADVLGIVGQVQAGAEADLQDVADDVGQNLLALIGQEGLAHQAVAESREDVPRVQAHRSSLTLRVSQVARPGHRFGMSITRATAIGESDFRNSLRMIAITRSPSNPPDPAPTTEGDGPQAVIIRASGCPGGTGTPCAGPSPVPPPRRGAELRLATPGRSPPRSLPR
jgi:hypothetical protein